MHNRSKARFINGILSALVVAFFVAHSLLGGMEALVPLANPPAFIMWIGVCIIGAHVIASVVTSREQLNDVEFPPSKRKKRHLALKWATGGILALVVIAHIFCIRTLGAPAIQAPTVWMLGTLLLVAILAIHICVGAKSLMTDLGLDKGLMRPFRIVICALAIITGCFIIAGAL